MSKASNEKEAVQKAAEAAYKQTGMEENVNKAIDKYIPDDIKKYGGNLAFIKALTVDKQISYKWEF